MDKSPSLALPTWLVHSGHLSRLSADEGTARLLTARGDALHHLSGDCDFELAAAVVVKEIQRLGTQYDLTFLGDGGESDAENGVRRAGDATWPTECSTRVPLCSGARF
jgi:hypothetical protein